MCFFNNIVIDDNKSNENQLLSSEGPNQTQSFLVKSAPAPTSKANISALLVKLKVCEQYLLTKASEKIQVNFTNLESQPIIKLEINNIHFSITLDTGSSFTIIPDKHFQQLKIPISKLNTEKYYSIQSASQIVTNAV